MISNNRPVIITIKIIILNRVVDNKHYVTLHKTVQFLHI